MRRFLTFLLYLPFLILSPLLVLIPIVALAIEDCVWLLLGGDHFQHRRGLMPRGRPSLYRTGMAAICWRSICLRCRGACHIIRATRSSLSTTLPRMAARISFASNFPNVQVLRLPENLGFGGGSNAGFRAAKNDVVVLLNSDMRVDAGFLATAARRIRRRKRLRSLLPNFLHRPGKLREETGLTQAWWQGGHSACGIASTTRSPARFHASTAAADPRLRSSEVPGAWRL